MAGTDPAGNGGIATVIRGYFDAGLADQWPLIFLVTHRSGGAATKLATWAAAWLRLAWLLARGRCGLLHLHASSRSSFWRKWTFHLLGRLGGVPVVWHVHGGEFEKFFAAECTPWQQRIVRRSLEAAFRVFSLSPQWRSRLQSIAPRAHIAVVRNGVPACPAQTIMQRRPGMVLFMGRLSKGKGLFDLLEAFQRATPDLPGARLVIAGDGDPAEVLACARKLGIGAQVELRGWIAGATKHAELARACVVALPSYAEGFPMVLLEAMVLATPAIATPVGGIPDLIQDNETGMLVAPGDVDGLAAALRRLLSEPALAARLGTAGQQAVLRDYSVKRALACLGETYAAAGIEAPHS